jgi:hypothetical protein
MTSPNFRFLRGPLPGRIHLELASQHQIRRPCNAFTAIVRWGGLMDDDLNEHSSGPLFVCVWSEVNHALSQEKFLSILIPLSLARDTAALRMSPADRRGRPSSVCCIS